MEKEGVMEEEAVGRGDNQRTGAPRVRLEPPAKTARRPLHLGASARRLLLYIPLWRKGGVIMSKHTRNTGAEASQACPIGQAWDEERRSGI